MVVRQLGERLRLVSLLAPRTQLVASIRSNYSGLVAPALLEEWIRDPNSAPGRLTSSPWPDHIEVESIALEPNGEFTVTGRVVELTSADLAGGGSPNRIPVRLTVARVDGRWLVVRYREGRSSQQSEEPDRPLDDEGSSAGAVGVVRAYYQAISDRRCRDAYHLWASNGAASGKSFEDFRAGFLETAAVEVKFGALGRLEAAAGSRYIEVPVRVIARSRDGVTQEFAGTYTLWRSVLEGATLEQRAWHVYSADVRRVK